MKTKKESVGMNRGNCETSLHTQESLFFQEWLAAGQPPEQLSISSVCNARCLFCSNRMNPFPLKKNVFREIEDVKLQLSLCSANYVDDIYMSDSLPGRISEGEAFLHPLFFEILTLVREKFMTNLLHFTTNASLLDDLFVRKLALFRPIEINVSLHSTQPKLWARIFRTTEKQAQIALESLSLLKKHHIDFTGTIVTLPRICGWDDLETTFGDLMAAGAKSIILWWPGFSDKTPDGLRKEIECPWDEFEDFVKRMQEKFPRYQIVPQPNLLGPRGLPIKRIMNFTLQGNLKAFGGAFHQVLWLVSEAAYPEISRLVTQFGHDVPNEHHVFPVKNRSYGGNIQVSGLLMVSDFLAAGREGLQQWPAVDLVLVPKMAFDAFFRDLQKTPAFKIPELLGKTTWLVFEKGSFLSLKGRGFVKPENDPKKIFERMLKFIDESLRADKFDAVSSLVAAFPIPTSEGPLKKREFRGFLKRAKKRLSPDAGFEKRVFEKLDDHRVICMEDWPTVDPSTPFSRWSFFRKLGNDWKLEMIFLGQSVADQGTDQNPL
jgi:NifB/MoaA-like Fe-S oxidoreductase